MTINNERPITEDELNSFIGQPGVNPNIKVNGKARYYQRKGKSITEKFELYGLKCNGLPLSGSISEQRKLRSQ